jgi:hypothetical protein
MITPQRYTLGQVDDDGNKGLYMDENGDYIKYNDFVELIAHAIEGAAGKEFLERQVPGLKKALVDILRISSASTEKTALGDADEIVEIASEALAK